MRIAAFTDEVNRQDLPRALSLLVDWGIGHVEIRSAFGTRFPRQSDAELDELGRRIRDHGLEVSGVSPGLFKCDIRASEVDEALSELLPRSCEWALKWGCDLVSCFAFLRNTTELPARVVDCLGDMTRVAFAAGCRLVLENEAGCWGNTGTEATRLVRQVEGLRLCWDPGNAARAGAEDLVTEYSGLCDVTEHVHVKNFDSASNSWSLIDRGVVSWKQQLGLLAADSYSGFLVIETHTNAPFPNVDAGDGLSTLEANSLHNLHGLRQLLASSPS
ncbi:MAG: sugar phosphate isomerase/epimerase [Candidatus Latescibacterota bacterium]|nr:sugar phosphate isomerase/epimerase [Candidatus Latescibacterota bacterium]